MGRWSTNNRFALLGAALICGVVPTAMGEDKNGVSPNAISRPSGPGSLEGLGDAFQPALNTGTAKYRIRFTLPTGVAGLTPELALQYDSGQGYGPAGIGWALDVPSIRRQVDRGLPRYIDSPGPGQLPDRFVGVSGEELVPLRNGYYFPKAEGTFVRYRRIGDSWEAHTRSGVKMQFGSSPTTRLSDIDGNRVFRWHLDRHTDTHGNVIQFEYELHSEIDREIYLSAIRYGPGSGPWAHTYSVRLIYENRPDSRTDYRSGYRVRSTRRLSRVDVLYDETLIRRYDLRYDAHPHWSLLSSVTQVGDDGITSLPPTTFSYATLAATDKPLVLAAAGHVIGAVKEPPVVMDNSKVELLDINADSLPDLVVTDAGHLAYLNRGERLQPDQSRAIAWEGPVAVTAAENRALTYELSEGRVHLADMTGDSVADLVVSAEGAVEYFANSGRLEWELGRPMSVDHSPPPAPFGPGGESIRTADLDFDKRIDVIRSDQGAYSVWFNQDGGSFSDATLSDGAFYNGSFVDFSDTGVHLADMNGDRLTDLVKVLSDRVVVFAGMGFGRFDESAVLPIPDQALDDAPGGNLERASLTDVNGDGLADLVVERAVGSDLWFWLNMGNDSLAPLRTITSLPATPNAVTRFADINGNGTTDIIYADSSSPGSRLQAVDLGELIAGTAFRNALIGIANGYGRKTTIEYRSSTEYLVDALDAGHPWSVTLPVPVSVVSRVSNSIGLDLDGYLDEGTDGDAYITDYIYRDGYYDPLEKQFRGFAFVKQFDLGDERFGGSSAPTLVTRYGFHTGAPDGLDNDGDGKVDEADVWSGREEEPLKAVELWREVTSLPDDASRDGAFADPAVVFSREEHDWIIRNAARAGDGLLPTRFGDLYQTEDPFIRDVRQPVKIGIRRTIMERQSDPGVHKHIDQQLDLDAVGNVRFLLKLGDTANPDDDLYTGYEYATNESGWIVDRVSRTMQRAGGEGGAFVSETRNYYDGAPFQGLALGQVGDRGLLHRSEGVISDGGVPPLIERSYLRGDPRQPAGVVNLLRQEFDEFGNAIVILDPNAELNAGGRPNGNGHERRIAYDPFLSKFPVRETVVIGSGSPDLEVTAAYHLGFGTPTMVTDFNGVATQFLYDSVGRLRAEIRPGDDPAHPTRRWQYNLGAPVSGIETTLHAREGNSPTVANAKYFDGLGRPLGTFEAGGPVMTGVTHYNTRGTVWKSHQPYFGVPYDAQDEWQHPAPAEAATLSRYDAAGRLVESISPPDADGLTSRTRKEYFPLRTVEYDGEDSDPASPHFQTPKTTVYDGLDRLVEVQEVETLSTSDSGTFITRYRFALPDLLAEIEDAKGNIKYLRYDGLGRKIFMNDCDRGKTEYMYDSAGNLISTVDAKAQQVQYVYDGTNRILAEDYLDDDAPLSLHRTPDVRFQYDRAGHDFPLLSNTRGRIALVEDLTGAEYRGYNARGVLETTVKRIAQPGGSTEDWTTVTLADSLDRIFQYVYPDGGVTRFQHDARGLLQSIPHFIADIDYRASGQRASMDFANGVVTEYEYDPRLRMTRMVTQSNGKSLQDLRYSYDDAGNILQIDDNRALPAGDARSQTASFLMDNCYRLIRATGEGYGIIDYDYDRLGNMVSQVSPDIADSNVNLGAMSVGGALGTFNRVGRSAADPPGPHALTEITGGPSQRAYEYDANGNMITNDGDIYAYDFRDRLGRIDKPGYDIQYLYDWTNRRVIKRVNGSQTSYVSEMTEIRDGEVLKYVFAGAPRVAQVKGIIPPPQAVAQRIMLTRGWNLISFQVDSGAAEPAILLAGLNGKCTAVFGHNGVKYDEYRPEGGGNNLTELLPNRGYWLFMTEAAEWFLEGALVGNEQANLALGLVGLPGMAVSSAGEFSAKQTGIRSIHAYLGDEIGWQSFHSDTPDFLNTLHGLAPGRGYWIVGNEATAAAFDGEASWPAFYHPDHVGSANVVTDANGGLVSEFYNYPFGQPRHAYYARDGIDPFYGFTDKERDKESDLQYFGARYLSDAVDRFLTPDPLFTEDPTAALSTPQRLHPYSYVHNNPLAFVDPSGLQDAPVYSPGYDTPEYHESFGDTVKLLAATAIGTVVDFFGGANTANAPESPTAPTQTSQTTNEVAVRVAINVSFAKVVGKIVNGIVNIERTAATPFVQGAAPNAAPEWVPVEIGKPIPGVKAPPITNPRLAAAMKSYNPSTPAQQLANQGQGLLAQHLAFGAKRPANILLNMAQSGQRARIGQLHLYFAGQHQQAVQAAAQQGASKPMLDALKNLSDMTLPLSGQ